MSISKLVRIFVLLTVACIIFSQDAGAKPACSWSVVGAVSVDGLSAHAEAGRPVSVVVRCYNGDAPGSSLTPPASLSGNVTVENVPSNINGVPVGWAARFPAQNGTYRFTVQVGRKGIAEPQWDGVESRDVTITVMPKATPGPAIDTSAFATRDEVEGLRNDVDALKNGQANANSRGFIKVAALITPNLPTTTTPAFGGAIEAGGYLATSKHVDFVMSGQLTTQGAGAPVDPNLRATSASARMWMVSEQILLAIAFGDLRRILRVRLGAGFGAKHYIWGQQVLSQEKNGGRVLVAEDKASHAFIFVPHLTLTAGMPNGVAAVAGVDLVVPTKHDFMVGRVPGGPAEKAGEPLKTGQVEPVFKIGIETRF